jgi:hypothetical protein
MGIKEKPVTNSLVPVTWATILVTGDNLCTLPITTKVTGIKEKPVNNPLVPVTWATILVTGNNLCPLPMLN